MVVFETEYCCYLDKNQAKCKALKWDSNLNSEEFWFSGNYLCNWKWIVLLFKTVFPASWLRLSAVCVWTLLGTVILNNEHLFGFKHQPWPLEVMSIKLKKSLCQFISGFLLFQIWSYSCDSFITVLCLRLMMFFIICLPWFHVYQLIFCCALIVHLVGSLSLVSFLFVSADWLQSKDIYRNKCIHGGR